MIGKYFIPFLETLYSAWYVRSLSWIYRLLWKFDGKASNYLMFSMSYTNLMFIFYVIKHHINHESDIAWNRNLVMYWQMSQEIYSTYCYFEIAKLFLSYYYLPSHHIKVFSTNYIFIYFKIRSFTCFQVKASLLWANFVKMFLFHNF